MQSIIHYTFYALTALLPLVFTIINFELFEFPKFLVLIFATSIITISWIFHELQSNSSEKTNFKKLLFQSPLNLAVIAFLLSQIISTIFSIHPHTSFWGYYSRFHQGLLTTILYTTLYFAYIRFGNKKTNKKLILTTLLTSLFVSLYAILQKLGIDKELWVQDVVGRPFSTLGQPNWLAAYLLPHFFLAFYFFSKSSQKARKKTINFLNLFKINLSKNTVILYTYFFLTTLALLFTKSRSGILAFAISYLIYLILKLYKSKGKKHFLQENSAPILIFLLLLLFVGTPFYKSLPQTIKNITNPKTQTINSSQDQALNPLEAGTKSTEIRKIVWQGALDLIKQKPFIGTGVETFAYSYYQVRPELHNYVSEWDFLYNKAHNELLNIAANSGLIGLFTYLSFFAIFSYIALTKYLSSPKKNTLYLTSLTALISIFISNFFGFSVIPVAYLTYIIPALALAKEKEIKKSHSQPTSTEYIFLSIATLVSLVIPTRIFLADYNYQKGKNLYQQGQITQSIPKFQKAIKLRPKEGRFYTTYIENLAHLTILAQQNPDTQNQAPSLERTTLDLEEKLRKLNPHHLNYYKSRAKTLITLAQKNPGYYQEAANILKNAIKLSPTDAKLYYNLGLIYSRMNDNQKAIQALNKSIDLKNDYENPYYALSLIYEEQNNLQELPPLLEKAKLNLATYSSQLHKKIQTYTEN